MHNQPTHHGLTHVDWWILLIAALAALTFMLMTASQVH
jgi:hypothetical protein